jgi:hypothetical protein
MPLKRILLAGYLFQNKVRGDEKVMMGKLYEQEGERSLLFINLILGYM